MSKMIHDQPSAAVPASRDRRNFLIAGAGLALAATTLGRSGAVMAKPAGQDTPNAPSDAAPVRKETLTTRVVTYQFTGPAPDGARVDSEGNVYVAISGQGRVMVFNRNGLPIGQIVLPDRDKGRNLKSTSLAIRPGHRELFIVANSGTEPGGAMIFRSGAFAPAPFPFSHQ
ncbi:hypothetical protein EE089_17555 [Klebsiella pneumoniae]|nr:hypothetical protein [Klebsiella pneumoniae]